MNDEAKSRYNRKNPVMGYAKRTKENSSKAKYQCIVSGEKRQFPCGGCMSPKGCLSTTMQYKEQKNGNG
jgi:hypothetical protein